MDYAALKFWLDVVQWAVMIAGGLWVWIDSRTSARKQEVDQALATVVNRVTIVEQRLAATPDHEDIGKVYERIEQTNALLNKLIGEFEAVRRGLDLINQHLLSERR